MHCFSRLCLPVLSGFVVWVVQGVCRIVFCRSGRVLDFQFLLRVVCLCIQSFRQRDRMSMDSMYFICSGCLASG